MVNFRIYGDFDPLFKNLIVPSDKDWDSLGSTAFLGKYMKEKSTGSLYRTRGLYRCHDFKTKGYHIKRSVQDPHFDYPDHFPVSLPSLSLKEVCRGLKYYHYFSERRQDMITLNIIFRNKEDYLKAEKELNVCKTHILEIPILSAQLEAVIPKIYKRFENLVETRKEILYLYKPYD